MAPELGTFNTVLRLSWGIRKVIYTTNAVESLHMSLRKVIKTRGSFPHEDAALKLLFLGLERIVKKWTRPVSN